DLGYFQHFGWDGGGVPGLKDAWLDYKFGSDLQLRAGQMKKPFSRQALMSDSTLEFVDRALVTGQYGSIGDIGVMLHDNVSESPKFEYAVGVFNGTGAAPVYAIDVESDPAKLSSTTTPRRLSPLVVTRFGYNHGDVKAYSEGDLEGGPCRFGIAGATQLQLDADTNDSSGVAATLDFIVKFHGFSTTGAYFVGWASTGDFADQEYARSGMNLQASYVIQKMIEPGVRYSRDLRKGTDNDSQEILGVVGFYPWGGHGFKVQLDAGALVRETAEAKATDIRVRAQTQVAF
ncbi:MAG: hypothetical protein EXR75_12250, partial [Myxococcales bacterium]|nr:hypothetical protein [Myxococcales bacterium]